MWYVFKSLVWKVEKGLLKFKIARKRVAVLECGTGF
jgi:hypothetical protein